MQQDYWNHLLLITQMETDIEKRTDKAHQLRKYRAIKVYEPQKQP